MFSLIDGRRALRMSLAILALPLTVVMGFAQIQQQNTHGPLSAAAAVTYTRVFSLTNPSTLGQSVTLLALVAPGPGIPGTPTGSVEFFDGLRAIGSSGLNDRVAALNFVFKSVGLHPIVAKYGGDGTFSRSTSVVLSQAAQEVGNQPPVVSAGSDQTINQSWDLVVSSNNTLAVADEAVLRFDGSSGSFLGVITPIRLSDGISSPRQVFVDSKGRLYVGVRGDSDQQVGGINRYDVKTGAFIDSFLPLGTGGPGDAPSFVFGPDGNLYITKDRQPNIKRYNGTTGAFIDLFATDPLSDIGLVSIVFGPDGNLYATNGDGGAVLKFDGRTGAFVSKFADVASQGTPYAAFPLFGPDGNLYVTGLDSGDVLRFNGKTGAFIDTFVAAHAGGLARAGDLKFGPDGNLYVADSPAGSNAGQVLRYDGKTGRFIGVFVPQGSGGLLRAADIFFDQVGGPAILMGTVSDDGLPLGGTLTVKWSKVSGPGTVTFGNARAARTTADFSAPGTYVLRLRPRDSQLSSHADTTITVKSARSTVPSIRSVEPALGQQGQTLSVAITGQNTHFVQGPTQVSLGAGIAVGSVVVSDSTHLTARLSIDAAATLGPRSITLTTGAETASLANGFTVSNGSSPSITSISPKGGQQSQQNLSVTITGQNTHFAQGTTQLDLGPGITVRSTTVTCPTCAAAIVEIAPDAALGARTVKMTTGAEVATLPNGFAVEPPSGTPILTSVVPAIGKQGQTVTLSVAGEFTHFTQGTTHVNLGLGVTTGTITVSSPTSLAAEFIIDPKTTPGTRTLTVTTEGEVVSAPDVFTVQVADTDTAGTFVGKPNLSPRAIATSTPTQVTVVLKVADPSLVPSSVNLLRLDSNGGPPIVLGKLHDDGVNGDLLAGDELYTVQVTLNEPAAGKVNLQISARFSGRSVTSDVFTIPVTVAVNLPPDPGEAGKATIQGIDSDGDGVRDDVQRYIALAYPASPDTRAVLTQLAKGIQSFLIDSADKKKSLSDAITIYRGMECSISINGPLITSSLMDDLISQLVNTSERARAYFMADAQLGGLVYTLAPPEQEKMFCGFTPSSGPSRLLSLTANCPVGGATIYFGNGVNVLLNNAFISSSNLFAAVGNQLASGHSIDPSCLKSAVAYDVAPVQIQSKWATIINIAVQVGLISSVQAAQQFLPDFPAWLHSPSNSPLWFSVGLVGLITTALTVDEVQVESHFQSYQSTVKDGNKVIVVAHSQGNLYVNEAYNRLVPSPTEKTFSVVGVATPANSVAGNGPYVTLNNDIITLVPFPHLPPNANNNPLPGEPCFSLLQGLECHYFDTSYLVGIDSGRKILDYIVSAIPVPISVKTDTGTGTGNVSSMPDGIDCGQTCIAAFHNNAPITLTATEDAGSTFTGWSGACVALGGTATDKTIAFPVVNSPLVTSFPEDCNAKFDLESILKVTKSGTGTGSVNSAPPGISCGPDCTAPQMAPFPASPPVQLTARPAAGSIFKTWGGDCASATTGLTAQVTLNTDKTCDAKFDLGGILTITKDGTGKGTVNSVPSGINCGPSCATQNAPFSATPAVKLSAKAETGSSFTGWGGDCVAGGKNAMIQVTLTSDKSCTAVFGMANPAVRLNPFGDQTIAGPYSVEVEDDSLVLTTAPQDITVTLLREVISKCSGVLFSSNRTVVVSQGNSTASYNFNAGHDPACNTLPITTRYTVTSAILGTNTVLDLSIVPPDQLVLSVTR